MVVCLLLTGDDIPAIEAPFCTIVLGHQHLRQITTKLELWVLFGYPRCMDCQLAWHG